MSEHSWVWVDGHVVDVAEARVSPLDHGLLTGDGVFETLRVYGGTPFALRRHLARMVRSCAGLGLAAPDEDLVRGAMAEVIAANGAREARIRVTVTGGVSPLGSDRGDGAVTVVVATGDLTAWNATADVVVVPWRRNEHGALAGLKTTSYGENVVALAKAREQGASEAIFANTAGKLCEGAGTNVFLVNGDGRLLTPTLSSGCLAGVTRALLLELDLGAAEEDFPVGALADATEAFLSSSTREVQPIRMVDGAVLPVAPGPATTRAAEAFRALVQRDLDP